MSVQLPEMMKIDVTRDFQTKMPKAKSEETVPKAAGFSDPQRESFEEELEKIILEKNQQEIHLEIEFFEETKIKESEITDFQTILIEERTDEVEIQKQPLKEEKPQTSEEEVEIEEIFPREIISVDLKPEKTQTTHVPAIEQMLREQPIITVEKISPTLEPRNAPVILELEPKPKFDPEPEKPLQIQTSQKSLQDFEKQEGVLKAEIIPTEEVIVKSDRVSIDSIQKTLQTLQEVRAQDTQLQEKQEESIAKEVLLNEEKKSSKSVPLASRPVKSTKSKSTLEDVRILSATLQEKSSKLSESLKGSVEHTPSMGNAKKESEIKALNSLENNGDQNDSQNKDRDNLTRQLSDKIRASRDAGETSFRLKLKPVDLGRVDVEMHLSKTGAIRLSFFVEKPQTLALLEESIHQLDDSLRNEGFEMGQGAYHFNQHRDGFQQWRDATTFEKIQNMEKDPRGAEALASKISYRLMMNPNRQFDDVA